MNALCEHLFYELNGVFTPEGHIMAAAAFHIKVFDAAAFQKFMKCAVIFQKKIFRAAAHIDFGNLFAFIFQFLNECFRVIIAFFDCFLIPEAFMIISIICDRISAAFFHVRNFVHDQCR